MKVLIITNLFPNKLEPTRATFNKQQIYQLSKLCNLKVIAPIPWAPSIGRWRCLKFIPYNEIIDEIEVFHPRYALIPKIGRSLYGFLFFASILGNVMQIRRSFDFDIILGTWVYPDGFATMLIAKKLRKPFVIKAHGSDINDYIRYPLRRMMIAHTLKNANSVISVANDLKKKLLKIGVPDRKVKVIPNGVDTSVFHIIDRVDAREKLGLPLDESIILFVGNLKLVKGVSYLIDSIHIIKYKFKKKLRLVIIGGGELKNELQNQVKHLGMNDIVDFIGIKSHNEIPSWMNACDLLCLPSLNEGMPNVALESLACGTPVVATKVGGIPEIIYDKRNGFLVEARSSEQIAEALLKAIDFTDWDRSGIALSVQKYSWISNARDVFEVLSRSLR